MAACICRPHGCGKWIPFTRSDLLYLAVEWRGCAEEHEYHQCDTLHGTFLCDAWSASQYENWQRPAVRVRGIPTFYRGTRNRTRQRNSLLAPIERWGWTSLTLLKILRITKIKKSDFKREMKKFPLAYRSTPQSTTGISPAAMLFNRKLRTKLHYLADLEG